MNTAETPLDTILDRSDGGTAAKAPPGELQHEAPTSSDPAGDGPADHNDIQDDRSARQPNWVPGHVLKKEREKRRALVARMREMEEENRALLDAGSYAPQANDEYQQSQQQPSYSDADIMAAVDRKLNYNASRSSFIAEHGTDTLKSLDTVLGQAAQAGHPHLQMAVQAAKQSDDPYGTMHQWASLNGLLPDKQSQQPQQRQAVFPSNLTSGRNVGKRMGPAWQGPMPMQDIFNRKAPGK